MNSSRPFSRLGPAARRTEKVAISRPLTSDQPNPILAISRDRRDIVLEEGAWRVAGVEVKAAATVTAADFRGLRRLREAAGRRFAGGIVLYDGETSAPFGDGLFAVPIRHLWENTS